MTEEYGRIGVCAPQGYKAVGHASGIKSNGKLDTAVVYSERPASAAGVFTSNNVKSAAVQVSLKHISSGHAQAVIMTSGNANAATGAEGIKSVEEMCKGVAAELGISPSSILTGQTGLIGIPLNREVAVAGAIAAAKKVDYAGGELAAQAIMTTDTKQKTALEQVEIGGKIITLGAMAKGAAMLCPSMATMLSLITTDAAVAPHALQLMLKRAMPRSFHAMVVDGCRSTNDTVLLLANGAAGNSEIVSESCSGFAELAEAVEKVCISLAMQMAHDAEGATKFMLVRVKGAISDTDAALAAHQVVSSNLVKCSLAGEDPYWGRVLSEVGASGAQMDQNNVTIAYGGEVVCKNGIACAHDTQKAIAHMKEREILIDIDLHLGSGKASSFGCDLTHGYIDENMRTS